jgi:membrane-associated phospholipid phosphatase
MFDTLIAVRDSWLAHRDVARPKPATLDPRIDPLIGGKRGVSFAPLQPALAGAAEIVLPYLFPQSAPQIERAAEQAAASRLYAGANYRSDVEAARQLGRSIGALVVEKAKADGIDSKQPPWPRPQAGEEQAIPSGGILENQWQPAPPNYELPFAGPVGNWKPQIMASNDQWLTEAVIPPPSTVGSQTFLDQTLNVLQASETLTDGQIAQAHFWDDPPSATATPPGHWFEIAIDQLQQYPMGTNEATRAFAYLGSTVADASIAAFGAKYYWWSIRPIHAIWRLCEGDSVLFTESEAAAALEDVCPHYDNSTLPSSDPNHLATDDGWYPIIDTPAFPAYPAGHGTFSGSAGRLLGYLFPEAGTSMEQFAELAANSRLYGGIHFDEDNDAGLTLGRWVAEQAIQRAETDGSVQPSP